MRRSVFLDGVKKTFAKAQSLLLPKNQDYGADDDALRNFKLASALGYDVPEAILIRMCDKMSRAATLLEAEAGIKGETIEDTLLDLINYAAILIEALKEEGTIKETEWHIPGETEPWPKAVVTSSSVVLHEVQSGPVRVRPKKYGVFTKDGYETGDEEHDETDLS